MRLRDQQRLCWCVAAVWLVGANCRRPATNATQVPAPVSCVTDVGAPDTARLPQLRIGTEPRLHVDGVAGDGYKLRSVAAVLRHADGSLVVANGTPDHLLFLDSNGRLTGSIRAPIEAPRTSASITWIGLLQPDTILAFEARHSRLLVVHAGRIVRSAVLQPRWNITCPGLLGFFADRTVLVVENCIPPSVPEGLSRRRSVYARFSLDGAFIGNIAELPAGELYRAGGRVGSFPFARRPVVAVDSATFTYGASDTYQLDVYSTAGEHIRQVCLARENRTIRASDRATERRARLAQAKLERPGTPDSVLLRDLNVAGPTPETMPAVSRVLIDQRGNAWVETFRHAGEQENEWTIFDRSGAAFARASMPAHFLALSIGETYVAGRYVDGSGQHHLRVYSITWP